VAAGCVSEDEVGIENRSDLTLIGQIPGTLAVLVAGQTTTRLVQPGELLVVGRDPNSGIVLADPRVSPRHASIERRGPGWLIRGLDIANPTWLLDATGRAQPIQGELGLRSGELLIGSAQVRLYPPSS
jgi:pSer/pThr/pTyr-binding forkhead associated (FHA) protein